MDWLEKGILEEYDRAALAWFLDGVVPLGECSETCVRLVSHDPDAFEARGRLLAFVRARVMEES